MKLVFTLLLSFSVILQSSAQVVKTLYKTFNSEKITALNLQFSYETEIEEWSERKILIETMVSITNSKRHILDALADAGRYDLKIQEGATLQLNYKDLSKTITYKGVECWENITVKVYVPKDMKVTQVPIVKRERPSLAAQEEPEDLLDPYNQPISQDEIDSYFSDEPDYGDDGGEYIEYQDYGDDIDYDAIFGAPSGGDDQITPP